MSAEATILFVDDDADFLRAQQAFFSSRGYKVITAETREQALRALDESKPDIIFLDLMMEHYDSGFTLGYRIRQDERFHDTPIVMLSGVAAATGQPFDAEGAGLHSWSKLDAFLDKPVTGRQLLRLVEEKVGTQSAHGA